MSESMTEERIREIMILVQDCVDTDGRSTFEYHDWDDVIECDQAMTSEELAWCRQNLYIDMVVKREN